ncbi:hypothetical protein SRHO_G00207640 [Serrasalmus rhombeus]
MRSLALKFPGNGRLFREAPSNSGVIAIHHEYKTGRQGTMRLEVLSSAGHACLLSASHRLSASALTQLNALPERELAQPNSLHALRFQHNCVVVSCMVLSLCSLANTENCIK